MNHSSLLKLKFSVLPQKNFLLINKFHITKDNKCDCEIWSKWKETKKGENVRTNKNEKRNKVE